MEKKGLFLIILLVIFLIGCSRQENLSENSDPELTEEQRIAQEEADIAKWQAEDAALFKKSTDKLDSMIKSGKTYKCELKEDIEFEHNDHQIFYIRGENFRGEGYYIDYKGVLPKISSFTVGERLMENGYCTYLWSIGEDGKITKEGGLMGCLKNFKPVRPFEIGELRQGAFSGATIELIDTCKEYNGEVQFNKPSGIEFVDFTPLSALAEEAEKSN